MNKNKKHKAANAARIILLVFLAALLGTLVYHANATYVTGNAVPMPLGFGCAVVLSGSMEPALSRGDLLVVVPSEAYEVDDIVVYQDGHMPVVHRIIAVQGKTVTTMGDANSSADKPINVSAIKGRVVLAIPLIGYAVNVLKTPFGILFVLGASVVLMERSFIRDKREEQEELRKIRQEIEELKQEMKKDSD